MQRNAREMPRSHPFFDRKKSYLDLTHSEIKLQRKYKEWIIKRFDSDFSLADLRKSASLMYIDVSNILASDFDGLQLDQVPT